jgi:hypothetical protein
MATTAPKMGTERTPACRGEVPAAASRVQLHLTLAGGSSQQPRPHGHEGPGGICSSDPPAGPLHHNATRSAAASSLSICTSRSVHLRGVEVVAAERHLWPDNLLLAI